MTESQPRSETSTETQPSSTPPNESSRLDKLRALLEVPDESPHADADESPQNAEAKPGAPKGKPKAFSDLAERLELTPADLYAIEVPLADGKSLSIGKLKDAAAKENDLTVRELQFEERVSSTEAEWTRAQRELQTLMASIDPKAIKPEVREQVRQHVAAEAARERALTLEAIPTWKNETVRDAELAGMVELLRDYGIAETFLSASPSHRLFRFVRDSFLRKQRIEAALARVTEVKKPSTTGRSSAGQPAARTESEPKSKARSNLRSRVLGVLK